VLSELDLLGPSRDSARAAATIQHDEYKVFGPESSPGNRIRDLYPHRIFTRCLPSKSDEDIVAYQADLKHTWLKACADELCLVVAVDVAVPKVATFQAVACALIFQGGTQVDCVVSATGRGTPPEVKCFALQLGISAGLSRGCQRLVVFSDSMPAVETLLDTSPRSGQIFSLDACKALRPWFAGDGGRSLTMWHVPSRWEWGVHKKAHNAAASVKISVGARPWTSRDFWLAEVDTHSSRDWHSRFCEPAYQGQNFLDLEGSKKNSSLLPSTLKGGPWMQAMGTATSSFARLCRCVINHAPLWVYWMRFNIAGPVACDCPLDVPVQTRDHVLRVCPRYKWEKHRLWVRQLPQLVALLNGNPTLGLFATALPREWDPG
jgi:hypothetical protein